MAGGPSLFIDQIRLTEDVSPRLKSVASKLPKSPKDMSRLRRRLASAGIYSFGAAVVYSVLELALPVLFAGAVLSQMRDGSGVDAGRDHGGGRLPDSRASCSAG